MQYDTLQSLTWAGGLPENASLALFLGITRESGNLQTISILFLHVSPTPSLAINQSIKQLEFALELEALWPFLAMLHLLESDYKDHIFNTWACCPLWQIHCIESRTLLQIRCSSTCKRQCIHYIYHSGNKKLYNRFILTSYDPWIEYSMHPVSSVITIIRHICTCISSLH